jgi:Protein of unknown function (DUF3767)
MTSPSDTTSSRSSDYDRRDASEKPSVNDEPIQTATWTRHLPERFGIRASIEHSKYRWCARESALWGIATGTTMSLHRFRMNSSTRTAINAGFLTCLTVLYGSYYFCYKRRDYQEQMIELMMKLNTFGHASEMPAEIPMDANHPFVVPIEGTNDDNKTNALPTRQYVATLPGRKEWQAPLPTQDAADVFKPVEK